MFEARTQEAYTTEHLTRGQEGGGAVRPYMCLILPENPRD